MKSFHDPFSDVLLKGFDRMKVKSVFKNDLNFGPFGHMIWLKFL